MHQVQLSHEHIHLGTALCHSIAQVIRVILIDEEALSHSFITLTMRKNLAVREDSEQSHAA